MFNISPIPLSNISLGYPYSNIRFNVLFEALSSQQLKYFGFNETEIQDISKFKENLMAFDKSIFSYVSEFTHSLHIYQTDISAILTEYSSLIDTIINAKNDISNKVENLSKLNDQLTLLKNVKDKTIDEIRKNAELITYQQSIANNALYNLDLNTIDTIKSKRDAIEKSLSDVNDVDLNFELSILDECTKIQDNFKINLSDYSFYEQYIADVYEFKDSRQQDISSFLSTRYNTLWTPITRMRFKQKNAENSNYFQLVDDFFLKWLEFRINAIQLTVELDTNNYILDILNSGKYKTDKDYNLAIALYRVNNLKDKRMALSTQLNALKISFQSFKQENDYTTLDKFREDVITYIRDNDTGLEDKILSQLDNVKSIDNAIHTVDYLFNSRKITLLETILIEIDRQQHAAEKVVTNLQSEIDIVIEPTDITAYKTQQNILQTRLSDLNNKIDKLIEQINTLDISISVIRLRVEELNENVNTLTKKFDERTTLVFTVLFGYSNFNEIMGSYLIDSKFDDSLEKKLNMLQSKDFTVEWYNAADIKELFAMYRAILTKVEEYKVDIFNTLLNSKINAVFKNNTLLDIINDSLLHLYANVLKFMLQEDLSLFEGIGNLLKILSNYIEIIKNIYVETDNILHYDFEDATKTISTKGLTKEEFSAIVDRIMNQITDLVTTRRTSIIMKQKNDEMYRNIELNWEKAIGGII